MSQASADDQPMARDPHGTADHGGDHGHDDHAHAGEDEPLGPIDRRAWGALVLGAAMGLVLAVMIWFTTAVLP